MINIASAVLLMFGFSACAAGLTRRADMDCSGYYLVGMIALAVGLVFTPWVPPQYNTLPQTTQEEAAQPDKAEQK